MILVIPNDVHQPAAKQLLLPSLLIAMGLHFNFAPPLKDTFIPRTEKNFLYRDRRRISQILETGQLPSVNWRNVKRDYETSLQRLLHRRTQILFIDINKNPNIDINNNPPTSKMPEGNVDKLMMNTNSSGCVIHGETLVYVATFTESVCAEIAALAEQNTGFTYQSTDEAIEGVKEIANSDEMQANECAVYTANFGLTCRPQRSTAKSTNATTLALDAAIGAPRGGHVACPSLRYSLTSAVASIYHQEFYPYFKNPELPLADRWYDKGKNRNQARTPRFSSHGRNLETRSQLKVFHPMRTSVPASFEHQQNAAAEMECRFRTLSEWIMANVFYPLPYGTTGFIAKDNLEKASGLSARKGYNLPCQSLCRPLPKGAVGIQRVKELHDDGNAAIIPGVWTSIIGDPTVCLRFVACRMNYFFTATDRRFCWFYGWVPHKTEVHANPAIRAHGAMAELQRLHHSAFSKPEFEHLSLILFSPKYVKETLSSYCP